MIDSSALVEGVMLGASLFASVGPKDTFVVKISIPSAYPLLIACVCAGSDALLIAAGASGLAAAVSHSPRILAISLLGGILYLACNGLIALRSAIRRKHVDEIKAAVSQPLLQTLLATAAVSLLNPYAWIDTVLVFGSIVANRPADARLSLTAGAVLASLMWFLLLTYGARFCRSFFSRAIAWRMLDGFAAVMMITLAIHLAISSF
ncbi:Putative amino-acid transporter [Paraburkholderia tropica]|uniref:LysE/ArgO family amino acid transporter n=1 Tax=Paraburkholderia TaxID=1822464 RepID=UPI001CB3A1D0|nr:MULTISPECIES: LysE family transporter [Paraburkholderia]CAG9237876.1 Putative amino-acid transporter [Paraburkholderia tropica]